MFATACILWPPRGAWVRLRLVWPSRAWSVPSHHHLTFECLACSSAAVAPASSSGIFGVMTSGEVWRRLEATPQVFLAASGDSLTFPRPD